MPPRSAAKESGRRNRPTEKPRSRVTESTTGRKIPTVAVLLRTVLTEVTSAFWMARSRVSELRA
jgi:hypothetical protein